MGEVNAFDEGLFPLSRVFFGAIDSRLWKQLLAGNWDCSSDAALLQLTSGEVLCGFQEQLPGRHWGLPEGPPRGEKRRGLLASLLGTQRGERRAPQALHSIVGSPGLKLVLRAVGRHLLWFAHEQLLAAQMLPPGCTAVVPVLLLRGEGPAARASPAVSSVWRRLLFCATVGPAASNCPIVVPFYEAFYSLEPAPAECPAYLVGAPGGAACCKTEGVAATAAAAAAAASAAASSAAAASVLGDPKGVGEREKEEAAGGRQNVASAAAAAAVAPPAAEAAATAQPWRVFSLSPKIRGGVSLRLPVGAPAAYSSAVWKWVQRPEASREPTEEGVSDSPREEAEAARAAANAANAANAATAATGSTDSWGVGPAADSRQPNPSVAQGELLQHGAGEAPLLQLGGGAPAGPSPTATRAVLSSAPSAGQGASRGPSPCILNTRQQQGLLSSQSGETDEGTRGSGPLLDVGFVHPALPFRVQFKGNVGGAGAPAGTAAGVATAAISGTQMVGIVWGLCRWLWFSNGRLLCPLDLPLGELMRLHAMGAQLNARGAPKASAEGWRETHVTVGVPGFSLRDMVEIEFQPAIPALLFKKNDVYQFGFSFDKFYQWQQPPRAALQQQQQMHVQQQHQQQHQQQQLLQPQQVQHEQQQHLQALQGPTSAAAKERDTVVFPPQRFRSTELVSACSSGGPRSLGALGPPSSGRRLEVHQGTVYALFQAVKERNVRWLMTFFAQFPNWLEAQDAAAAPGSCTFASLEQQLATWCSSGGSNSNSSSSNSNNSSNEQLQQHITALYGEHAQDTPLKLAIRKGYSDVVQVLIEEGGCNPEGYGSSSDCITPLMLAAELGQDRLVAALVCTYGAWVDRRDAHGDTALHKAAVRAAEAPETSSERLNPTARVSPGGRYNTIRLLLSLGADASLKNNVGISPLVKFGGTNVAVGEASRECVEVGLALLERAAVAGEVHQARLISAAAYSKWNTWKAAPKPAKAAGISACAPSMWGSLLANCTVVVGGAGEAALGLHALYIDGERRDAQGAEADKATLVSPGGGAEGATGGLHGAPSHAGGLQQQVQLQMQTGGRRLSSLKGPLAPSSSSAGDKVSDFGEGGIGAWAGRSSTTSLISSNSAAVSPPQRVSGASSGTAGDSHASYGTALPSSGSSKSSSSSSSSTGSAFPSLLRPSDGRLPLPGADARTLLQKLLVWGLELKGGVSGSPRVEGSPAPLRAPLAPLSPSLLSSLAVAEGLEGVQTVFVAITERLLLLEEQSAAERMQPPPQQQPAIPQQQGPGAAPLGPRMFDGLGHRGSVEEAPPVASAGAAAAAASHSGGLQRLASLAEAAESSEDLCALLLPLDSIACSIEGGTRHGWEKSMQRVLWRRQVMRDLGYQVSLGGEGGVVWTPDVQLLEEASSGAGSPHEQRQQLLQEGTITPGGGGGGCCGLLVMKCLVDTEVYVVQAVSNRWCLKLDIWLRQLADFFDGPEEVRTVHHPDKHHRIAALIWQSDRDRDALLLSLNNGSTNASASPFAGKANALEELERAAALKEEVLALVRLQTLSPLLSCCTRGFRASR